MRRLAHTGFLLALGAALSAPAAAQVIAVTRPRSDAVAKLEQARDRNPNSIAALRALGVAYYKLDRFQDARTVLDQARKVDPRDGVSALYAGLAAEQLRDFATARDAYNSYLQVGRTQRVKNEITARLVALTKEELKTAARAAVASEATIAQQPGPQTTLAVMPFQISHPDTTLRPLERGLADLVITDLAKVRSGNLRIVERERMQAITDEIRLGQTGQVDQTTAVRAGKIIQAGRILNGALTGAGQTVAMSGVIANTSDASVAGSPTQDGTLNAIFTLEKNFVYSVLASIGRPRNTLTAAEQQAIDQAPTQSLQALLAYSRGLMAEDAGRFDEAAQFYENARTLDPGFGAALQRAQSAAQAQQGQQFSAGRVEQNLRNSAEGQAVAAAERGQVGGTTLANTLNTAVGDVNPTTTNTVTSQTATTTAPPTQQNTTSQATGTDQPTRLGQVIIVIRKP